MRKALSNKKGFTLIEMIIVIVIIAILAAIAIPSLLGYQRDARRAAAEANARTAYTAAAAALASAQTAGWASPGIGNLTGVVGGPPATADLPIDTFEEKTADLLGSAFPGSIAVEVTNGNVSLIVWSQSDDAILTGATTGDHWVILNPNPTGSEVRYTYGADLQ